MKFLKLSCIAIILIVSTFTTVNSSQKKGKSLKSSLRKSNKNHKNSQVNLIKDASNFGSDINVVVRKNPTVFTDNRYGLNRLEPLRTFNNFGNSNTSNLPNVGGYGKTAEIVNPTILFHSSSPVTMVKTQPAHLGYRNEKTTVTSFNKATGKTETHDIIQKTPIYGEIESIKTGKADTVKQYDLQYRRFRAPKTTVRMNGELNFPRNERFVNE